jgi:hypothetical protein
MIKHLIQFEEIIIMCFLNPTNCQNAFHGLNAGLLSVGPNATYSNGCFKGLILL